MEPSRWVEYGIPDAEMERLHKESPVASIGSASSPEGARKFLLDVVQAAVPKLPTPDTSGLKQEEIQIPVRDGSKIRAIVVKPENAANGPLIVQYHGGGWVTGLPELSLPEAYGVAKGFGATYVAVDYRKAPEYKFPYAVHDAVDSTQWAYEHAAELNADTSKGFILAGLSAGGILAAVATHWARDNGIKVTGTHLLCPALLLPQSVPEKWKPYYKSLEQCKGAPFLDAAAMQFSLGHYEPDPTSGYGNIALWKTGHKDLPPTYIAACGYDPVRDDALIYDEILRENGNKTKVDVFSGLIHTWFIVQPEHSATMDGMQKLGLGYAWLLTSAPQPSL